MSYRDKKNPWHVIFDEFKERHLEIESDIVAMHPVIYPVIQIDFKNGAIALYHGKSREYQIVDKNTHDRVLFDMLVPKD